MATQVYHDLSKIHDEELLRRMWQQTDDFGRKKEIRAHMYKLREARLRDFYTSGSDMDTTTGFSSAKNPLSTTHGDSLQDQSFESFKTKEIRDSTSPTHEMKFSRGGTGSAVAPDTSGWNIVTSAEVTPDGKTRKTESLATTEGIKRIPGGRNEFAGRNEHMTSDFRDGDDKNFVASSGETSKTQLHEHSVTGDEKSGRTETKQSSTSASSSHFSTTQKSTSGGLIDSTHERGPNRIVDGFKGTNVANFSQQQEHHEEVQRQQRHHEEHHHEEISSTEIRSSSVREEHQQHRHHKEQVLRSAQQEELNQQQRIVNERQKTDQSKNLDHSQLTNQMTPQQAKKAEELLRSATSTVRRTHLEEEVQALAAIPGQIVSRKIEYPNPTTKMIIETKKLADGTTITTKQYERVDANARQESQANRQQKIRDESSLNRNTTVKDNTQVRRDSQKFVDHHDNSFQQSLRTDDTRSDSLRRSSQQIDDKVDRSSSFSTKKNKKLVENFKDQVEKVVVDSTHKTVKKDMSQMTSTDFIENERGCVMHDNTSRRPEKYTAGPPPTSDATRNTTVERENFELTSSSCLKTQRQSPDFSTHGFPSVRAQENETPKQKQPDFTTHGFPSVKPKDDTKKPSRPSQDFTTNGFPSVRSQKPGEKPSQGTNGFPSVREQTVNKTQQTVTEKHVQSSNVHQKSTKDFTTQGFPSVREPEHPNIGRNSPHLRNIDEHKTTDARTSTTECRITDQQEKHETGPDRYTSGKPYKPSQDFTTHGFPSVRSDTQKPEPLYPIGPTTKTPSNVHQQTEIRKTSSHQENRSSEIQEITPQYPHQKKPNQDFSTAHGFPSTRPRDEKPIKPSSREQPDGNVFTRVEKTETEEKFQTRGFPSVRPDKVVSDDRPARKQPQTPSEASIIDKVKTQTVITEKHSTAQAEVKYDTHGYPSARPQQTEPDRDRPTQPAPKSKRPTEDFTTQGFPSVRPQKSEPNQPDRTAQVYFEDQTTTERRFVENQTHIKDITSVQKPKEPQDFTTHGFPSVRPQKPKSNLPEETSDTITDKQKCEPRHPGKTQTYFEEDYTTEQHRSSVEREDHIKECVTGQKPKKPEDFTTHGFPSVRPQKPEPHHPGSKSSSITEEYKSSTRDINETYEESPKQGPKKPSQDFTTHGFPSARPQKPEDHHPGRTGSIDDYTTTKITSSEKDVRVSYQGRPDNEPRKPDQRVPEFTTHGFPSARPQDSRPHHPGRSSSSKLTDETAIKKTTEQTSNLTEQNVNTTYRHDQSPPYDRQPIAPTGYDYKPGKFQEDTESVTTEQTEIREQEWNQFTNSKITVEVNAAHETFARSLRCVSPAPDRETVKNFRTSTPTAPRDRRSNRSPSRESDSSKISTSTVTKVKVPSNDLRRTTPIKGKPRTITTDIGKSSDTINLTSTRIEEEEITQTNKKKIKATTTSKTGERLFRESKPSPKTVTRSPNEVQPKRPYNELRDSGNDEPNISSKGPDQSEKPSRYPKSSAQDFLSAVRPERAPNQTPKKKSSETSHIITRQVVKNHSTEHHEEHETCDCDHANPTPHNGSKPKSNSPHYSAPIARNQETTTTSSTNVHKKTLPSSAKTTQKPQNPPTKPLKQSPGKHTTAGKPQTIHSPVPKEFPQGYAPKTSQPTSTFDTTKTTSVVVSRNHQNTQHTQKHLNTASDVTKVSTSKIPDEPLYDVPEMSKVPEGPTYGKPSEGLSGSPYSSPEPSRRPAGKLSERPGKFSSPSPYPSPERSTNDARPATGISGDTTKTSRFSETVSVKSSILRDNKRTTKNPKKATSDDEGFEPESPRSQSPTSETSDQEYPNSDHRTTDLDADDITIEINLKNVDKDIHLTSSRAKEDVKKSKHSITTDFIDTERLTTTSDKKKPKTDDKVGPKINNDLNLSSPVRETSRRSPSQQPRETTEIYHSSEKIDKNTYYKNRNEDEQENDDQHPESFYLKKGDEPKKSDGKKPRPPLNRTETFEERCRKIIGIDEQTSEDTTTSTTRRSSRQKETSSTSDFITSEKYAQNRFPSPKHVEPIPSPRSKSPKKNPKGPEEDLDGVIISRIKGTSVRTTERAEDDTLTPRASSQSPSRRSNAPTRETSPHKRGDVSPDRDSPHPVDESTEVHRKGSKTSINRVEVTTNSSKQRSPIRTIDKSPERPNHITTAKIHLSPTSGRKPSNPEVTQSPQGLKVSPVTTTPIESSKTTVSEKINSSDRRKKVTTATTNTKSRRPQHDDDEDSVISDSDDVIGVNESRFTTTKTSATSNKQAPKRNQPLSERKDSAPVYRTTKVDKDVKISRSTSDNLIKTTTRRSKPDIEVTKQTQALRKSSLDKTPGKSNGRHPTKCTTTKTINLSATNTLINSQDMENVVIDIQQAKSSREPTPNRLIPTPVPFGEDTGNARYPDRVVEPEDEPKRRQQVNNIPIFEEETNSFVGCHISEVDDVHERSTFKKRTSVTRQTDYEHETYPQRGKSPLKEPESVVDDECLLSVHQKVSKFVNTAEEVKKSKPSAPFKKEPTIEDYPESDDCLLSVDAKVNKFLATAERLATQTTITKGDEKPLGKLPAVSPQRSPELVAKVERQVSKEKPQFSDESERNAVPKPKSTVTDRYVPQKQKPDVKGRSKSPIILRSTEAVKKAKSVFEKVTSKSTATTNRQKDILPRPSVWEGGRTPTSNKPTDKDVKLQDIGIYKALDEETEEILRRERSRSRTPGDDVDEAYVIPLSSRAYKTTTDSISSQKNIFEKRISSTKTDEFETREQKSSVRTSTREEPSKRRANNQSSAGPTNRYEDEYLTNRVTSRRPSGPYTRKPESDSPSSTKYPSDQRDGSPTNHLPSGTSSHHSHERITSQTTSATRKHTSPTRPVEEEPSTPRLSRPSKDAQPIGISSNRTDRKTTRISSQSNDSLSVKRNLFERPESTTPVPNSPGTQPSYMDHTRSSIEHRRDSVEITKAYQRRQSEDDDYHTHPSNDGHSRSPTKFGVELKRTNSGDGSRPRRKSSSTEIPHIEDIFDLQLLEKMLETVVGYEQRRRIRAQIRIVKKLIETQKNESVRTVQTSITKKISETIPSRKQYEPETSRIQPKKPEAYVSRRSDSSPVRKVSPTRSSKQLIENESHHTSRHEETIIRERSVSPQSKIRTITTVTEVRRSGEKPVTKKTVSTARVSGQDDKPEWATRNILKKASENDRSVRNNSIKRNTTTTSRNVTSQKLKTSSDEDCITSSYGIGPTDVDGRPLFGLRALKKKPQTDGSDTTKVTGTVMSEHFYSENGSEPVGERTVTMYSSDSKDIDRLESSLNKKTIRNDTRISREKSSKEGVTSLTRTQKIGNRSSNEFIPALTNIKTTPKIARQGSVKEISEKFVRKESSSSVTEKTSSSSYPKAGLILRTQTHNSRSSTPGRSIRSESVEYDDIEDECDIEEVRSTSSRKKSRTTQVITESESESESITKTKRSVNSSTRSFLNSAGSKVTGVTDVLDRMRNADNVVKDGDTLEDQEARSLLNKFLGASVLMSGVESMVPKEILTKTPTITVPNLTKEEVTTTRVTKTVKKAGSSSPVASETFDIEEIWDEELLKELLEKSTNYEERRRIRARLRQVMAEREACTDIVASVTAELQQKEKEKDKKFLKEKTTTVTKSSASIKQDEEEEEDDDDDDDQAIGSDEEYEEIVEEIVEEEEEDDDGNRIVTTVTTTKTADGKTEKKVEIKKQDKKEIKDQEKPPINKKSENELGDPANKKQEEGESLILPLLQGLLHKKNMPPMYTANQLNHNINNHNSNVSKYQGSGVSSSGTTLNSNSSSGKLLTSSASKLSSGLKPGDRDSGYSGQLTIHPVEDSGTESGEDLKLIAAGLRNSMQMNAQGEKGLINEVTEALSRLEASLKEGKDIKLDSSKRNALLTLVGRLQTGLVSPDKITAPTPAPDEKNCGRTEDRSSPEGDGRRKSGSHQRFAKRRNRASRHTVGVSREELADARRYIEEMVMRENMSNCTTPESQQNAPLEFPYPVEKQSSTGSVLSTAEEIKLQEPAQGLFRPNQFVPEHLRNNSQPVSDSISVVQLREKKPQFKAMRQSVSIDLPNEPETAAKSKRPLSESYSFDVVQHPQAESHHKQHQPASILKQPSREVYEDENRKSEQTVYEKNLYNKTHHSTTRPVWGALFSGAEPSSDDTDAMRSSSPNGFDSSKSNKFINKKLLMKRANTIDIPKPMRYINEMESDSDAESHGVNSTKTIGLRGTVQVSVKGKPRHVVPAFQPKTENDHKFLAFIQKQSPSSNLSWNNPNKIKQAGNNWTTKFGNIFNTFEAKAVSTSNKPPMPTGSARNFWKKAEASSHSPSGSKKILNSPKTNDRIVRPPWADKPYGVEYAQQKPKEFSRQEAAGLKIQIPKPVTVNQFSHAPMSVFKPISPVKTEAPVQFKPIQHETTATIYSEPKVVYKNSAASSGPIYAPNQIPFAAKRQAPPIVEFVPQNYSIVYPTSRQLEPAKTRENYHPSEYGRDTIRENQGYQHPFTQQNYVSPDYHSYSFSESPISHKPRTVPSPTKCRQQGYGSDYSSRSQPSPTKTRPLYTHNIKNVSPVLPWAGKESTDNRVLNIAASRFEDKPPGRSPTNLNRHNSMRLQDQAYLERVHSYDRREYKRPSLPNTGDLNSAETIQMYYNNAAQQFGSYQNLRQQQAQFSTQNQLPYTTTDYTQPGNVSTYVPDLRITRSDSLTNPQAEPLILTPSRPFISPKQANRPEPLKIFDFPSSPETPTSPILGQNDYSEDDLDTDGGLMTEYKAESKVMRGPVSQQATRVNNRTNRMGDEDFIGKHSKDAKNLLNVMKNLNSSKVNSTENPKQEKTSTSVARHGKTSPKVSVSPVNSDGRSYQAPKVAPAFPGLMSPEYTPEERPKPVFYQQGSVTSNQQPQYQQGPQPYSSFAYSDPEAIRSVVAPQAAYQQNPAYEPPARNLLYRVESPQTSVTNYESDQSSYSLPRAEIYQQADQKVCTTQPHISKSADVPKNTQHKQATVTKHQQEIKNAIFQQQSSCELQHQQSSQHQQEQSSQHQLQRQQNIKQQQELVKGYQQSQQPVNYQPSQQPVNYQPTQQPVSYQHQQPVVNTTGNFKETISNVSATYEATVKPVAKVVAQVSSEQKQTKSQTNSSSQSTYTMPSYQKTLTNSRESTKTVSKTVTRQQTAPDRISAPFESPVKKSFKENEEKEKDESIPILKKFGPAQPHLYHPNAYQYPLAGQTETRKSSNVGSGSALRKFSEPTIKSKTMTQTTTIENTLTASSGTVAPNIVETPSTPMPIDDTSEIPKNIVFNNISQFTAAARRQFTEVESEQTQTSRLPFTGPSRPNPLSKSDSWHQICQQAQAPVMKPPSPHGDGPPGHQLRRAKSGHTLQLPKMYEGVLQKSEVEEKQRTVAAYFSGQKSPTTLSRNSSASNIHDAAQQCEATTSNASRTLNSSITATNTTVASMKKITSINRVRSNNKASISNQNPSTGLVRSQTMPHIANIKLLDESNVDDAFEQLLKAS